MKKKNLAFTLAEVLIVIGIIGVVAALTLPNLNHATGEKERVTKVKKIYSSLTEAFDRAQAIYGDADTWFTDLQNQNGDFDSPNDATASERFAKRVTEFMKISKDCGLESGCLTPGSINFLGTSIPVFGTDYAYKVITADGMSLAFAINSTIAVDIDGPNKGSFELGKDLFLFVNRRTNSNNSMLLPATGGPSFGSYNFIGSGYNAAGWIIQNDNADYLKADSSGKCHDSNIILDGTTNTSCH